MPHLRDKLPGVWLKIRDRLGAEKEKRNYISLSDYFAICQEFGLNQERAQFLSEYLHNLGVILHYHHDPLLQDTVILKPEWATEAVYTLIDTPAIQENRGSFRFADLESYWDSHIYPRDKHPQLVRLMEKFELCFNFSGTHLYFVPEMLVPLKTAPDLLKNRGHANFTNSAPSHLLSEAILLAFTLRIKALRI